MALVIAACGGDGGSGEDAAPPPAPTEATTTLVTAPPSTDVATTAVETTTEPTTTTTAAPTPTTTIDPAEALAEEVERDYREAWARSNSSLQKPLDKRALRRALAYRTGPNARAFEQKVTEYQENGWAIRSSSTSDPSLDIEAPAELVVPSSDLAVLIVCEVDPWVLVEVGGAPDGSDAIVDDGLYAYRSEVFMRLAGGVWRVEGGNQLGEWAGTGRCGE